MRNIFGSKILLFIIALLIGYYLNFILNHFINPEVNKAATKISDIIKLTNEYYVDKVNLDTLTNSAIEGVLKKLDPHSGYLNSEEYESYAEEMSGKFVGIGIEFSLINDTLNVMSVVPSGPSDKVGVQSGDKIIMVDNRNIISLKTEKIISLLRGDEGSKVVLTIVRNNVKKPINFTLNRAEIILHPVDFSTVISDSIGYIKLVRFSENTYVEMRSAVNSLIKQGAKKILLDLRNNPGGYLEQAVKVADLFLSPNKLIVSIKARKKSYNQDFYSTDTDKSDKLPIIVLVDNGSASASEIVAGAIQDWDRGWIVGQNTFGKGLVQQSFILDDRSEFRLTLAKYFTPSGRLIQRKYDNISNYYSISEINKNDTTTNYKFTKKGRKVYDGGGIHPDFLLKEPEYTESLGLLLRNNVFNRFIAENGEIEKLDKKKYNYRTFNSEFIFTEKMFNNFIIYAKTIEPNIKIDEINKDKSLIIAKIKSEIANKFWGKNGRYYLFIKTDEEILQALNYFSIDINRVVKKN